LETALLEQLTNGVDRAARICSRDQRGLAERVIAIFSPVGLDEHAVDVFEVHDTGLINERLR
jgi:hypothetical protein